MRKGPAQLTGRRVSVEVKRWSETKTNPPGMWCRSAARSSSGTDKPPEVQLSSQQQQQQQQ